MLNEILDRLDKVKKAGKNYVACCPVHQDNNPSMSISEQGTRILIYCHACGAKGSEVVQAVGLSGSALFNDEPQKTGGNSYFSKDQREQAKEDAYFIEIYDNELSKGHQPSREEYRRYKLSQQRVKVLGGVNASHQ